MLLGKFAGNWHYEGWKANDVKKVHLCYCWKYGSNEVASL